jgi:hypothetical protein
LLKTNRLIIEISVLKNIAGHKKQVSFRRYVEIIGDYKKQKQIALGIKLKTNNNMSIFAKYKHKNKK